MDVGDRRIGIAVSDSLGWTAQAVGTLERKNNEYDFAKIKEILVEYQPEKLVIGLPKNMNGTLGPQGEKTTLFAKQLEDMFDIEIVFWDERLTTVFAHKTMIEANVKRKDRKKKVDTVAAVLILQSYLDYLNNKKEV